MSSSHSERQSQNTPAVRENVFSVSGLHDRARHMSACLYFAGADRMTDDLIQMICLLTQPCLGKVTLISINTTLPWESHTHIY